MTHRPLILIADDDPAIRLFLERAVQREGFRTMQAGDGRQALELLHEHPVDVLLMDVQMPVMDGLQTLREIRASDRLRTLPVILVTGSGPEVDQVIGLESGADDYLAKPVAVKELAARVRAQVRGREAWARELERGREGRRKLAAAVEGLARDVPLLTLAGNLVVRLPQALDVDGVAILHFARDATRSIASSGVLQRRFPATQALAERIGQEVAERAASGPWLEEGSGSSDKRGRTFDVAYVPFRLGPGNEPLGCLAFAQQPGSASGQLSHRLPDLIDATDFIVTVLRPAVEQAESANVATTRMQAMIAGRHFAMHLQPIVRLSTGETVAVEALTRFTDGSSRRASSPRQRRWDWVPRSSGRRWRLRWRPLQCSRPGWRSASTCRPTWSSTSRRCRIWSPPPSAPSSWS